MALSFNCISILRILFFCGRDGGGMIPTSPGAWNDEVWQLLHGSDLGGGGERESGEQIVMYYVGR